MESGENAQCSHSSTKEECYIIYNNNNNNNNGKFGHKGCKIQEFATPAREVTSVKLSTMI